MLGSAETSRRLACDASRVVMRHAPDGQAVEVGARTRTIPPALRRALRHWAHGGPTTLSNLALLCRRHHRAVHEEGYQVDRHPDGELRFRRPDGRLLPAVPPPRADGEPWLAGRAPGRGLGDRRHAPVGGVDPRLYSADPDSYGLPRNVGIKLNDKDIGRAKELLKYRWFQKKDWQEEIKRMLASGLKYELDALANKDFRYLTKTYLPRKLKEEDWLN